MTYFRVFPQPASTSSSRFVSKRLIFHSWWLYSWYLNSYGSSCWAFLHLQPSLPKSLSFLDGAAISGFASAVDRGTWVLNGKDEKQFTVVAGRLGGFRCNTRRFVDRVHASGSSPRPALSAQEPRVRVNRDIDARARYRSQCRHISADRRGSTPKFAGRRSAAPGGCPV